MRRPLVLALAVLAATPAAARGEVLARIPNESTVSVYRSTVVVSVLGSDDIVCDDPMTKRHERTCPIVRDRRPR